MQKEIVIEKPAEEGIVSSLCKCLSSAITLNRAKHHELRGSELMSDGNILSERE